MSLDLFKPNERIRMFRHDDVEESENDDAWDDRELIKAYDKCVKGFRKEKKRLVNSGNPELTEASVPGPWVAINEGDYSMGHSPSTSNHVNQQNLPSVTNAEDGLDILSPKEQIVNNEGKGDSLSGDNKPVAKANHNSSSYQEEDQAHLYLLTWTVGSHCRAVYSEDSLEYEAKIIEIGEDLSYCVVRYVGYGNEEEVPLKSLKSSEGKKARDKQRREALSSFQKLNNEEQTSINHNVQAVGQVYHTSFNACESSFNACKKSKKSKSRRRNRRRKPQYDEIESESETSEENESSKSDESNDSGSKEEQVHEPQTPGPSSIQHDWMKAFPNLFIPPMPASLASNSATAHLKFGKGELPSLLMSWYMSGYHAGYFDAKQDLRIKKQQLLMQQQKNDNTKS